MRWLLCICLLLIVVPAFAGQSSYARPSATATGGDAKQLAKLQKERLGAKAVYLKKPKDSALRHRYVVATVKLGTATMMCESLDRKVKYRDALRLYREALKLEPDNREAANNRDLIEGIYRSMGRPIPK